MVSLSGTTGPPDGDVDHGDTTDDDFIYGYVRVVEKYPGTIVTLILLVTLGCGAIAFLVSGLPPLDNPSLGFETRGTELTARDLSFLKFLNADPDVFSPIPRGHTVARRDDMVGDTEDISRVRRQESSSCPPPSPANLKIVFQSSNSGSSLFEVEHLRSICLQEERHVRTHASFLERCHRTSSEDSDTSVCCPSWSLGYAVALMNNKSSCSDITQADVRIALEILRECSPYYTMDDQEKLPSQCSRGGSVFNIFHYLTLSTFSEDVRNGRVDLTSSLSFSPMDCSEREMNCLDIYDENFQNVRSLSDGITDVVALDLDVKIAIFQRIAISDFVYLLLGFAIAAGIIWAYTGSFLIMTGSLSNMFFSAVLAIFFYHVVFRVRYFLFPNFTAFVLVIGIGADDTFVYVDLWKAALAKFDGKNRRQLALQEATRHAIVTLLVTTLTTTAALFASMLSDSITGKCFALYAGTALVCNFLYTVTWLPAIIVLQDKHFKLHNSDTDDHPSPPKACVRFLGRMFNKILLANFLRSIFQTFLPKVIYHLRYVWIVVFLLIGTAGAVFTFVHPRLRVSERSEVPAFRDNQPLESYDQIYRDNLDFTRSSAAMFPIQILWGIQPTRESNRWNPADVGSLELDDDFQLGDEETQEWLAVLCEDIKQQWFYGNSTDFCFIDSFREWMSRPCGTVAEAPCCDQRVFPFPEETFDRCAKEYSVFLCGLEPCSSSTPGLRFDVNGSIVALFVYFDSSVTYTTQFKTTDEFWKALSSWTDQHLAGAPLGLARGLSYSESGIQLRLYDLQSGIRRSTTTTISLALGFAAAILLITTRNLLITFFAVATISFTVVSTMGTLVWLGWELNIFEALALTIAVGLSVDFSIHFGVAYALTPYEDRRRRTTFVITTLGSAITAAALSTFSAGAAMVFAVVNYYFQMGTFLMVVMVTSWLFSVFFFLPLCMAFGPNGDTGKLSNLFRGCRKAPPRQHVPPTLGLGALNPAFTK